MLAKVIAPRRRSPSAETGFARRVDYVCGKAMAIALGNLAGVWTDAAFQMEAVAGMNGRLRRRCYHMVLSWGDGENPDDRQALAAARGVLREMGWDGHQHVLAVHRDQPNVHVHVVLNRVHPLTGRAYSTSHDYARLERACRIVERAFGWPPDRGRFLPRLVDGALVLIPRPKAHWDAKRAARAAGLRPDPRGVRGAERRSGVAPLRDRLPRRVITQARSVIEKAASWAAVHAGLLGLGLRYLRHGTGARIAEVVGGGWMPASHLGTAFGLHRLCARIGAFRPAPAEAPAAPDPTALAREAARGRHAADRARRRGDHAELRQRQKRQAADLRAVLCGMDSRVAAAFRQALADDQRADRETFRKMALPRLLDYGLAPSAVETLPPNEQRRRRHRHLLREGQARTAGAEIAPAPLDHTRARQLWQQALGRLGHANLAHESQHNLLRVGPRHVLLSRRSAQGDILGYDLLTEDSGRLLARPVSGGELALGLLGPPDAPRCIVTADAGTAAMISTGHPELLVIAAAHVLSRRVAQQLVARVDGRPLHVVCHNDADARFAEQVIALLPHATRIDAETSGARERMGDGPIGTNSAIPAARDDDLPPDLQAGEPSDPDEPKPEQVGLST